MHVCDRASRLSYFRWGSTPWIWEYHLMGWGPEVDKIGEIELSINMNLFLFLDHNSHLSSCVTLILWHAFPSFRTVSPTINPSFLRCFCWLSCYCNEEFNEISTSCHQSEHVLQNKSWTLENKFDTPIFQSVMQICLYKIFLNCFPRNLLHKDTISET